MAHPKQNIVQTTPYYPVSRVALTVGTVGALVGGASSAAKNIRKVKNNEISSQTAAKEIFKEAAGVGVAIGAATAVVKSVAPRNDILSIWGIAALATCAKIVWDSATCKHSTCKKQECLTDKNGDDGQAPPCDDSKNTEKSSKADGKATKNTTKKAAKEADETEE